MWLPVHAVRLADHVRSAVAAVGCAALLLAPTSPKAAAQDRPAAQNCVDCHREQAAQIVASVHDIELRCQDCHGGETSYAVAQDFDHGPSFRGKIARRDVPQLCGDCHADVQRMNPYGLRTDQLSAYKTSGHGRRLDQFGDERVAVCIDCHGSHDIRRADSPESRTHFQRIPETCGRCHADAAMMRDYGHPTTIVEEYRASVHGRNVLEHGDAGSPNCATCHGSHGAAPPGAAQVGQVCGRCHQQVEQYFATTLHSKLPLFARCIGCHSPTGDLRNHQIQAAGPTPDQLVEAYVGVCGEFPAATPESRRWHFKERSDRLVPGPQFATVCQRCHSGARADPHAQFVGGNDERALLLGRQLGQAVADAQYEFAAAADRVARLTRGVLLVRNEALRVEDAKTELVALVAASHTLDPKEIQNRSDKVSEICDEIHAALNAKERGLTLRRIALAATVVVLAAFIALMYRKYLELRRTYVCPVKAATIACPAAPEPLVRRRFLDGAIRLLGTAGLLSLAWPVVAYILPARKRGGAAERISAGKAEGWAVWEAKKVLLGGKPVAVVRTDQGYRAVSLVCTHLGCIVHWEASKREFECPCHAARFDDEGKVLGGPPPRPLPQYGVAVVQGDVVVGGSEGA
jgi:Rieske Fe-S protein